MEGKCLRKFQAENTGLQLVYYIRTLCSLSEQTVKLGLTSHLEDFSVGTKGWVIHLKLNKINIVNPHFLPLGYLLLFCPIQEHPPPFFSLQSLLSSKI